MDSDEITSNSGCSKAPSGGHGRVRQFVYRSGLYYVNITLYLQPGVKNRTLLCPTKRQNFACTIFKKKSCPTKMLWLIHYQQYYGFQLR